MTWITRLLDRFTIYDSCHIHPDVVRIVEPQLMRGDPSSPPVIVIEQCRQCAWTRTRYL